MSGTSGVHVIPASKTAKLRAACDRCNASKVKCSGNKEDGCARCVGLGVDCVYSTSRVGKNPGTRAKRKKPQDENEASPQNSHMPPQGTQGTGPHVSPSHPPAPTMAPSPVSQTQLSPPTVPLGANPLPDFPMEFDYGFGGLGDDDNLMLLASTENDAGFVNAHDTIQRPPANFHSSSEHMRGGSVDFPRMSDSTHMLPTPSEFNGSISAKDLSPPSNIFNAIRQPQFPFSARQSPAPTNGGPAPKPFSDSASQDVVSLIDLIGSLENFVTSDATQLDVVMNAVNASIPELLRLIKAHETTKNNRLALLLCVAKDQIVLLLERISKDNLLGQVPGSAIAQASNNRKVFVSNLGRPNTWMDAQDQQAWEAYIVTKQMRKFAQIFSRITTSMRRHHISMSDDEPSPGLDNSRFCNDPDKRLANLIEGLEARRRDFENSVALPFEDESITPCSDIPF